MALANPSTTQSIAVQQSGTNIGAVSTLNFTNNINVSSSGDTATVSV